MPKPLHDVADALRAYLSAGLHRYHDPDTGEQRTRTRAAVARDLKMRKATVCRAWRILDMESTNATL